MRKERKLRIGGKITLILVAAWLAGAAVLIVFSYGQSRAALMAELRVRAKDYAALGAELLPADEHARLAAREDEGSVAYDRVIAALQRAHARFEDVKYVYTAREGPDGKIYFVGDSAEDIEDRSRVGDLYDDASALLAKSVKGIDEAVVEEDFYTDQWGTFISAYAPIRTSAGTFDGLYCVDISLESVRALTGRLLVRLLASVALLSAVLLPVAAALSRGIVLPVRACADYAGRLAEGDFSTTVPPSALSRGDELGELARADESMARNIRSLLRAIKEETAGVAGGGEELSANMAETAASMDRIAAAAAGMRERARAQSESIARTHEETGRIREQVGLLDELIESQAACVAESSSSNEQMVANIKSVSAILQRSSASMDELVKASESGREGIEEVSSLAAGVERDSEAMLEAVDVIQNLAGQTSLLAMNAAIEAAHAGESGKGFSVVADEIRKLAEGSAEEGGKIAAALTDLKSRIDAVAASSARTSDLFGRIIVLLTEVRDQESIVKEAMQEQDLGSSQVLEAIREINAITAKVKEGSDRMLSGSEEVLRAMVVIDEATGGMSAGIDEIAAGTGLVAASVQNVNELARGTRESIARLSGEVGRFTL